MTPKDWAVLAQAAYSARPDLGPEDSAGRVVFQNTGAGLALTIPGTDNGRCVLADVDAVPFDAGGCGRVHRGIWEAFDPVWPGVLALGTVKVLDGHSEGAAGAIYLAARLCLAGKPPEEVWAWEPPMTSIDGMLAGIFLRCRVKLHVMWHGNDLVPDLPVTLPGVFDWQHAGPPARFGKAALPVPNLEDHAIAGIVADL